MKAVCSSYDLDLEKFKEYCSKTTDKILSSYSWYTIPPKVHKLLEHCGQIAKVLELPFGYYLEEAKEAQNKENQIEGWKTFESLSTISAEKININFYVCVFLYSY